MAHIALNGAALYTEEQEHLLTIGGGSEGERRGQERAACPPNVSLGGGEGTSRLCFSLTTISSHADHAFS